MANVRELPPKEERYLDQQALQNLKEWLIKEDNSADRAAFASQSIQSFYLHYVLPAIHHPAEVGITAKRNEHGGQHVWLHTFWPTPLSLDSAEQSIQVNDLIGAFTMSVAIPLLPNPSLHLDFISPDKLPDDSIQDALQAICRAEESQCIGLLRAN